jgi:hypothetical protein
MLYLPSVHAIFIFYLKIKMSSIQTWRSGSSIQIIKINTFEISRAAAIQRFKDSESEMLNYLLILLRKLCKNLQFLNEN